MILNHAEHYLDEVAATPVRRKVAVTIATPGGAKGIVVESFFDYSQPTASRDGAPYVYGIENEEKAAEELEKLWLTSKELKLGTDATLADVAVMQKISNLRRQSPSGMEIISAFLECNPDAILIVKKGIPRLFVNVVRYTISQLMDDSKSPWRFGEISAKVGKNHYNIPSGLKDLMTIETGPTSTYNVPTSPTLSVRDASGKKKIVVAMQQTSSGDYFLSFFGVDRKVIDEISKWFDSQVERFNFLKCAKIDGNATFLKIGKTTWDDIVLAPGIRERIDANIINMFNLESVYIANGIPAKRGFVVLGEPGTGKTTLARILATELKKVTFIWVVPSAIYGSSSIASVFDLAQALSPTIVFFEDADIYMAQRGTMEASGGILTEIMNRLDGVVPLKGVVTGISTNRPEILESALINRPGRFDLKIYLGPPDCAGRIKLLTKALSKVKYKPEDVQKAANHAGMNKMTPCKIEEIARRAIMKAIEQKQYEPHTQQAYVSLEHLIGAVEEFNDEQRLSKADYVSTISPEEQTSDKEASTHFDEIMESCGLAMINEEADPDKVRDFFSVIAGNEYQLTRGDYNKPIANIDGLMKIVVDAFKDSAMMRILRRQGVRRANIVAANRLLDNDEGVTLSQLLITLTGEEE